MVNALALFSFIPTMARATPIAMWLILTIMGLTTCGQQITPFDRAPPGLDNSQVNLLPELWPTHERSQRVDATWLAEDIVRRDTSMAPNIHPAAFVAGYADPKKHRNTGFIDLNSYWDTRDFGITTINAGAKLPHKFEYFQLLNLQSPYGSGSFDWTDFYTEVNLRRPVWKDHAYLKHLDWTAQYADGSTASNVLRLGVKWRFQDTPGRIGDFFKDVLKLNYAVNFYLIETDGSGWQMEHTYRRKFFDDRMYIGGFTDHNINNGGRDSTWVSEHQIGVRIIGQWHAVAEYRYKSFAPPGFESGWGVGLEYVIRFE